METITVIIDSKETEIDFNYFPAERGQRENGILMTPDYPAEIEIVNTRPEIPDEIAERAVWDWIGIGK